MTTEQLQNTRAERWRQKSNPALTSEDAKAWIEDIGLCLFLPRRGNFLAAAPSFVEAAMGAPSEVPGREAIENASALMRRLAADAAVIPLNLFGNSGSDQPDFLASRATLSYIFSLIGGRNWKSRPGMRASPLMTEIWTLLNDGGARTAREIQAALGRELTEAAVLRALAELWHGLRVIPVYDGDVTRWELTQARFAAEMTASQKVAQTTALSALVSLYLDGAVAASSEEVETFLSPLTARSRVREVVNGLSATRQLGLVSVGAQPLLHVTGALPEFEGEETKAEAVPRKPREKRGERTPHQRDRGPRPFRERVEERKERPFPKREFKEKRERPAASGGKYPKRKFGGEKEQPSREPRWKERRGAHKPFGEREEKPPYWKRREEDRTAKFGGGKKFESRKFEDRGKRPFFRERPVEGEGAQERWPGPERKAGWKPKRPTGGKPGFKSQGRSDFRGEAKPGFKKAGKPFGKSARPEFKKSKFSKPAFGKPKQGGFKPPFRKRKKKGDGDGE